MPLGSILSRGFSFKLKYNGVTHTYNANNGKLNTLICGNGKFDLQKTSEAEIVSEESDAVLGIFYFVGFFNRFL
jgi:hypothetical protein